MKRVRQILVSRRGLAVGTLIVCNVPMALSAQVEVSGRVLRRDSLRTPVVGAHVSAPQSQIAVVSDSTGRFRLLGLRAGVNVIVTRAIGFRADTTEVETAAGEVVVQDITLSAASGATLAPVNVVGEKYAIRRGKMAGFDERRRGGVGRFIDREELERADGRTLSGILAKSGNVDIRRGGSGKAWAVSGRAVSPGKCAFCRHSKRDVLDIADIGAGAAVACYMDVWMDGSLIYDSTSRQAPLFDLNSLDPSLVEGIEIYTSASEIPAQYNRTSGGCGAILLWTRNP